MTITSKKMVKDDKKVEKPDESKSPDLESIVQTQVLEQLGKPKNLISVKAHNVFDNCWRVDVWLQVEPDNMYSRRIVHSYFIKTSPEGGFTYSNPEIVRLYNEEGEKINVREESKTNEQAT
jgi:hypothetical protein